MIKRILSLLAALAVLSGYPAFAREGSAADDKLTRISDILRSLGIAEQTNSEYQGPVTRAEYSDMIAGFLNIDAPGGVSRFTDVPADHWAAGSINALVERGIADGFSAGTFRPEETITYEQAVKILVSALGYQTMANYSGGYPDGYLQIAWRYNLLEGISYQTGDEITLGDALLLLYNGLDAPMMTYMITDGNLVSENEQNVLEKCHSIYADDGIISATDITRLGGTGKMPLGQVMIGTEVYMAGDCDVYGFLGYPAAYYYREASDGERTLLYLEKHDKHYEEVTIDAFDLEGYQNRRYTYTAGSRKKTAEVSVRADIVYNGKAYAAYDKMCPAAGYVTLIDNDRDGQYDVVKIYEEFICVVFSNNAEDGVILDRYDQKNQLVYRSGGDEVRCIAQDSAGMGLEPEGILKNDVLTVYRSVDGAFVRIILHRETAEGGIVSTSYQDTLSESRLRIGEQEYGITPEFFAHEGKLLAGSGGIFYLDAKGRIAAMDKTYNAYVNFGYLTKVTADDADAERLYLKIFTSENEFEILRCAEKVKIDGGRGLRREDVLNRLTNREGEDWTAVPQLLTYELNSSGEIAVIDTTAPDASSGGTAKDTLQEIFDGSATVAFKSEAKNFGMKFGYTDSTVIFNIPDLSQPYTNDDFSIITERNLVTDQEYAGVRAYSIYDDSLTADAIVMSGAGEKPISGDTKLTVVTGVAAALDENQQETYEITGNTEGTEISFLVSYTDKEKFENLKKQGETGPGKMIQRGDVIRYGVNTQNQANTVSYVYDGKNQAYQLDYKAYLNDFFRTFCGQVTLKDDGYIRVSDGTHEEVYKTGGTILVCEVTDRGVTVRPGSLDDIADARHGGGNASRVLIRTRYMVTYSIIVFK